MGPVLSYRCIPAPHSFSLTRGFRVNFNVMLLISSRSQLQHQILSPRATNGSDSSNDSDWSTMQITTPIIVGVVLIIIFAAYLAWYRWSHRFKHHFRRVRDAFVSRFSEVFRMPRYRHRVKHTSMPVTLDESMHTPNPRNIRRYPSYARSDSTDSQTPLRSSIGSFPPHQDPPRRSTPEKRSWRWWRIFGAGPREVKPKVPNSGWVVDDSSTMRHGDGSFISQSVETRPRWTGGLAPLHEQASDDEGDPSRGMYDRVIQIGDPDISTHSMSPTYQDVVPPESVPTSARTAAPEYSAGKGPHSTSILRTMTTAPTSHIQQSVYTSEHTQSDSPAPPMYSTVSHTSVESLVYPANSDAAALYPWSLRGIGRTLPRIYQHERQISTESVLVNSAPMIPQSMY